MTVFNPSPILINFSKMAMLQLVITFGLACALARQSHANANISPTDEQWSATVVTVAMDGSLETFRASSKGLVRGAIYKATEKGGWVQEIIADRRGSRVFVLCTPKPKQFVVRTYDVVANGTLKPIQVTQVPLSCRGLC